MTLPIRMTAVARQHVADITKLTRAEARKLAQTEYERLLSLLQMLEGDDWQQPTYCTEWNVREMVAHLAGAVTQWSSFAQFRHYSMQNPYLKEFDEPIDGINKLQVVERADKPPADLVAEFRQNGPKAIEKGMMSFGECQYDGEVRPYGYLGGLGVHQAFRRRGIATDIVSELLAIADERFGPDRVIFAQIQAGNEASLRANMKRAN